MTDSKKTDGVQVKPFGIQLLEAVPAQDVKLSTKTGVKAGLRLHSMDIFESKGVSHTYT